MNKNIFIYGDIENEISSRLKDITFGIIGDDELNKEVEGLATVFVKTMMDNADTESECSNRDKRRIESMRKYCEKNSNATNGVTGYEYVDKEMNELLGDMMEKRGIKSGDCLYEMEWNCIIRSIYVKIKKKVDTLLSKAVEHGGD